MIKTNLLTIKNNEKSSLFIYAAMFVDKNNQFYKKDEELFKIAVKNSINAGKMSYFNNQYCVIGRNNMKIPCSIDKHKINVLSESHYLFLRNRLIKIIKLTHKFIQAIPDSNGIIGGHFGLSNSHSTNEETIIDSILLRMMHNANSCNVLELASQILFKINANHIYNNGNKRTALISTFSILHWLGFCVNMSPNELLKKWERIMINVASYKIIENLQNEERTIRYIKKNIKKIIMLLRTWKK